MAIDDQVVKIQKWADSGDRTDPEMATPPIDRDVGYDATYSGASGNTPDRGEINQKFRELTGVAVDVRSHGILPWDARVDYVLPVIVQASDGTLHRGLAASGPTTSNATNPLATGQSIWGAVSGSQMAPNAPSTPTGDAGNAEIVWVWNCPLDNGAEVTEFQLQHRQQGASWPSATITVNTPRYFIDGLTNGVTYQIRARAVNSIGTSGWSGTGSATPQAEVPGQVFGLVGTSGENGDVPLSWEPADARGATISQYIVQWRTSGQSFGTSRQTTTTQTSITLSSGISNGTEYFFRVRARNSRGTGDWSREASATPAAPVVPPPPTPTPARFQSTQNYSWPWANEDRALIRLVGGSSSGTAAVVGGQTYRAVGPREDFYGFEGTLGSAAGLFSVPDPLVPATFTERIRPPAPSFMAGAAVRDGIVTLADRGGRVWRMPHDGSPPLSEIVTSQTSVFSQQLGDIAWHGGALYGVSESPGAEAGVSLYIFSESAGTWSLLGRIVSNQRIGSVGLEDVGGTLYLIRRNSTQNRQTFATVDVSGPSVTTIRSWVDSNFRVGSMTEYSDQLWMTGTGIGSSHGDRLLRFTDLTTGAVEQVGTFSGHGSVTVIAGVRTTPTDESFIVTGLSAGDQFQLTVPSGGSVEIYPGL